MSLGTNGEGIVLDRPGAPARLSSDDTSATAFFEIDGNMLELTMLFSEPDDPASIFRTRVRQMLAVLRTGRSRKHLPDPRPAGGRPDPRDRRR